MLAGDLGQGYEGDGNRPIPRGNIRNAGAVGNGTVQCGVAATKIVVKESTPRPGLRRPTATRGGHKVLKN